MLDLELTARLIDATDGHSIPSMGTLVNAVSRVVGTHEKLTSAYAFNAAIGYFRWNCDQTKLLKFHYDNQGNRRFYCCDKCGGRGYGP